MPAKVSQKTVMLECVFMESAIIASSEKRRDDKFARGLCEYSASDIAPTSLCDLKEQEKRDPNLYSFSDNGLSAHLEKQK